ncbi:hypothetical protein PIB30_091445 [Stylosanthes scabra]|uniref:Uncharacterized protein n=1 Tax=Stylosanthes scabra TaxID=79078 RepID=A0ABU6YTV3_9FABA|nr:hypothetical protein [Stylosanthes scabra]
MSENLCETKSSIVKKLSLIEDFNIVREKELLEEREHIEKLILGHKGRNASYLHNTKKGKEKMWKEHLECCKHDERDTYAGNFALGHKYDNVDITTSVGRGELYTIPSVSTKKCPTLK